MCILNFGSLNLDYVYQVDHFVQPGETLSAASQSVNAGGKGLNQSIALARALCTAGGSAFCRDSVAAEVSASCGDSAAAGREASADGPAPCKDSVTAEVSASCGDSAAAGNEASVCSPDCTNKKGSVPLVEPGSFVYHAGCIGAGGESLKSLLEENGVNTDLLLQVPELQGNAVIQVEQGGENCILLFGGSNQCITEEQIEKTLKGFGPGDVLVLQNEINLLPQIVEVAYERGMQIFLNPSPYNEKVEAVDLGKISWLLVNAVEARQICESQNAVCESADEGTSAVFSGSYEDASAPSGGADKGTSASSDSADLYASDISDRPNPSGKMDPAAVWEILHRRYPRLSLLVTLGKRGSIAFTGTESVAQGAFPVKAVDSTGAGDTYTGYFIAALSRGLSLQKAMQQASMASAISVTRPGAAPSIPMYREVAKALGKLAQ
jgi:ribokinase